MAISITNHQKKIKVDLRHIRQSLRRLLKFVDCSEKEISLLFVDDREIQNINHLYLNRDWPTNVISFSYSESEFHHINPDILGDIVLSVDTALRDAEHGNISLSDELDFLIIHGLLHILGYDHENGNSDEMERMKKKEQELFFLLHGYNLE